MTVSFETPPSDEPPEAIALFGEEVRVAGETMLAWCAALHPERGQPQTLNEGVGILTDRRLCFYTLAGAATDIFSIPVTEPALSYSPRAGDPLIGDFRTAEARLMLFIPAIHLARFEKLLGTLARLRDAQAKLTDAHIKLDLMPPVLEGEGTSAAYQLMRLAELLGMGLLTEPEYWNHNQQMIARWQQISN